MLQPTFPQIQPQGVPHGSLSPTPPPPAFPQIQPLGVPHGSLSQNPATHFRKSSRSACRMARSPEAVTAVDTDAELPVTRRLWRNLYEFHHSV